MTVCLHCLRRWLGLLAPAWIDLPAGLFKEQGTNVNAAIVLIDRQDFG